MIPFVVDAVPRRRAGRARPQLARRARDVFVVDRRSSPQLVDVRPRVQRQRAARELLAALRRRQPRCRGCGRPARCAAARRCATNPRVGAAASTSRPTRASACGVASTSTAAATGRPTRSTAASSVGATIQARSNVDVFVGPSCCERNDPMQYVDRGRRRRPAGRTTCSARIHQTTRGDDGARELDVLAAADRCRPTRSRSSRAGRYSELKDVDQPARRGTPIGSSAQGGDLTLADGTYTRRATARVRASTVPTSTSASCARRSVLRWEYRPGSTVFAIWSHGRTSDASTTAGSDLGRDLRALGSADSENVVMVKANYWIGL